MVSDILDHPVHENWQLASLLEQIPCQKQGNTVPPHLSFHPLPDDKF